MLHDWVIVLHQLMLDAYFDWVKRVPLLKEMSRMLEFSNRTELDHNIISDWPHPPFDPRNTSSSSFLSRVQFLLTRGIHKPYPRKGTQRNCFRQTSGIVPTCPHVGPALRSGRSLSTPHDSRQQWPTLPPVPPAPLEIII